MAVLITISLVGIGTYAYFSDTETSPATTFTAGTLELNGPGIANFNLGTIGNMAPGDKTGDAVIYIQNVGTVPLGWFGDLVISGGNKLREAIYIDYALMQFEGGSWAEADDNFILNGRGSGPYPGEYNKFADLSPFKVLTLKNFDGGPFMNPGTGYEFMGALKPGYAYRLTLRFGFAEGAGNEYQGSVTSPVNISFKVDATQVKKEALKLLVPTLADAPWTEGWMNGQLANQTP